MVFNALIPPLSRIGKWDEAVYIYQGRLIASGQLPEYALNPAVDAVYSVIYLCIQGARHWLEYTCWIGRGVFFLLLWVATFRIARALREEAHPLILIALAAVSPAIVLLLDNGTNAMFAAFAGLALAEMIPVMRRGAFERLWRASAFIGLAALSRNEAPVLFVTFAAFAAFAAWRERRLRQALPAILLPFFALTGGYVVLHGAVTGEWALGTRHRAYATFEQGHGMAFADTYGGRQPYVEGEIEARRLFGTPEENADSIFRAIARNPAAYFARIPRLTRSAAGHAFDGYGKYLGIALALFAVRGLLALVQRRALPLAALLIAWSAYAGLYVLLCFQPHHLLIPFLAWFPIAAIGVDAWARNLDSRRERRVWTVGLATAAILAAILLKPNSTAVFAALVLLLTLWIAWIAHDILRERHAPAAALAGALILLSGSLALRAGPAFRVPVTPFGDPEQKAVDYLAETFPPGTRVAAWGPGLVWAANMEFVRIGIPQRDLETPESLAAWLAAEGAAAIVVDDDLRRFEPETAARLSGLNAHGYILGFATNGGEVLVLVRERRPSLPL
ncbi:MAG: hypothetical protein D6781_08725 [Verrucomicrobia bacterium]|nr:MAG: hypothetical protein D6781_08725 [Verrucomicrobiota bacterium]